MFPLVVGIVPNEKLYGEGRQLMFIDILTPGFEAPDNSASFLVTGQWSIIHQCEVMLGLLDAVKLLPAARLGTCLPDILSVVALACSSSIWHSAIFHVSDSDSVHMDCFVLQCNSHCWSATDRYFATSCSTHPPTPTMLSCTRQTSDWHCAIVVICNSRSCLMPDTV